MCLSQAALAVVYVSDYYRKDGTHVKAHYRNDPHNKSFKNSIVSMKIKKEITDKGRETLPVKKPLQFKVSSYSADGEALD
jgi:hypothetical protein